MLFYEGMTHHCACLPWVEVCTTGVSSPDAGLASAYHVSFITPSNFITTTKLARESASLPAASSLPLRSNEDEGGVC